MLEKGALSESTQAMGRAKDEAILEERARLMNKVSASDAEVIKLKTQARPAPFASRSVLASSLKSQANPGSRYRCSRSV